MPDYTPNNETALSVWRCDKEHHINKGDYVSVYQVTDGKGEVTNYMFCPYCFGEWLQGKWPIIKVEP